MKALRTIISVVVLFVAVSAIGKPMRADTRLNERLQAACLYNADINFSMPTPSRTVTSKFGKRWGRSHKGLDIKVQAGDTIRAAFCGQVCLATYNRGGYGYYIVIQHKRGLQTLYAHLSKHLVKEGETVQAGDPIGLGGNTGRSTGSHLHFETRLNGEAINPATVFDFARQDLCGIRQKDCLAKKQQGKGARQEIVTMISARKTWKGLFGCSDEQSVQPTRQQMRCLCAIPQSITGLTNTRKHSQYIFTQTALRMGSLGIQNPEYNDIGKTDAPPPSLVS